MPLLRAVVVRRVGIGAYQGVACRWCFGSYSRQSGDNSTQQQQEKKKTHLDPTTIISDKSKCRNGTTQKSSDDTIVSFRDFRGLKPKFLLALERHSIMFPTAIQQQSWYPALRGDNIMGRSRTGTGKTLAYMLPALHRLLPHPEKVQVLIISPSRELALQIGETVKMLTTQVSPDDYSTARISSRVMVGGVSKQRDLMMFEEQVPAVLVATPGRLRDHLMGRRPDGSSAKYSCGSMVAGKEFREYFSELQVLVLDEVDSLLHLGFEEDLRSILTFLPDSRQNLVYSATIPLQTKRVLNELGFSRPGHAVLDVVASESMKRDNIEDHFNETLQLAGQESVVDCKRINQSYVVLPPTRLVSGIVQMIAGMSESKHHKIIVFFPTTAQVEYFTYLFKWGLGRHVVSLHSKKNQARRATTSEWFRDAKKGILFSSDLTARGMDYPNVTNVVHVGMAADRETYIHRVGRTGQLGKTGASLLVFLMEEEKAFLQQDLVHFDVSLDPVYHEMLHYQRNPQLEMDLERMAREASENMEVVENAGDMYRSMLGFYHARFSHLLRNHKNINSVLVKRMNDLIMQVGLRHLPFVSEQLVKSIGHMEQDKLRLSVRTQWTPGQTFDVGRFSSRH